MAGSLRDGRAELIPIDFFAGPPVQGCDFYYVRATLPRVLIALTNRDHLYPTR